MCSLRPFSLDAKQEDEDLHVVVEKSGMTVMIDKEIEEISREEIVDETDSYQSNQSKLNERMRSRTIIDSIEPMDSSCLQTTAFLPQSNIFNSIDLIHKFFFNLIPQCHRHDSSAHIAHQLWVVTNTCQVFILILCAIAGVLGIWHIMNQRYVLTFLMFLYISNLSYIHPGNSESLTI